MLKQLRIQNIILIENATVNFSAGLNTLTGETGSGKSAIMYSLSLAIGERADTSIIRKGCDRGFVEAVFDCDTQTVIDLLKDGGIDHELDQELIIRRELVVAGKGRVFINNQPAQLAFLKKLGPHLVQIVGQNASQRLLSLDYHQEILDLFGALSPLIKTFRDSFNQEQAIQKKIELLTQHEAQRLREISVCQLELEELDEAQLKEGEDEELFNEYSLLVNAEEIATKVGEINQALTGDRQPVLVILNRQKQNFDTLLTFDSHLQDTVQAFQNAFMELQEISHTLRHYQNKLHANPERLRQVNERLTLINRLKRKFGSTFEEISNYHKQTQNKLFELENADLEIEQLQQELDQIQGQTTALAQQLTQERKKWALQLESSLTQELHSLNMSKAILSVSVTKTKRSRDGEDQVEFFLSPNIGEHQISLREGASGGEISRVLLTIQKLLAGKVEIGTLIFDEIDGNIGGETATIVGQKLSQIASKQHQVIFITHFPQAASQADYHLQIMKEEREGRTLTLVRELDADSRKKELSRMAGVRH